MFFILLGLCLCAIFITVLIRRGELKPSILFLCLLLMIPLTALGTVADWGNQGFTKAEEYKLYAYEDCNKYIKIGNSYYYFNINANEKYGVEYEAIDEMQVKKSESKIYENDNIEIPVIVKYTAKPIKNFFTFGIRESDEMFKFFIPTGSYTIK